MIVAIVALACGATVAFSVVQPPTYTGMAAIAVADPNTDLALVGSLGNSTETPQQRATAVSDQVLRNAVLGLARLRLRTPRSIVSLRKELTVSVDPTSFVIDVTAADRHAVFAAALANAVAGADVSLGVGSARAGYAAAAARLANQIATGRNPSAKLLNAEQLSRLRALATLATPLSIDTLARTPATPSSPKPVRNGILGALVGLLLAVSLASFRASRDHRVHSLEEVESGLGLPVIGHVRGSAMGQAVGLTDVSNDKAGWSDIETFRVIRQNLEFLDQSTHLRTVVVTSPAPQDGKSTVAASLALASAAVGKRTLLVECDLRRPVLAERLGLAGSPGLVDYLAGAATPEEVIRPIAPAQANGNRGLATTAMGSEAATLTCIPAGRPPAHPAELLASDRFRTFLDEASQVYELIVLDTPPLLAVVDPLELIPLVDGVVLCVRLGQTTVQQLRGSLEAFERLPPRPTGVVVTDLSPRDHPTAYGYYYYSSDGEDGHAGKGARQNRFSIRRG